LSSTHCTALHFYLPRHCLQSFHNVDAAADIWNHVNPQFWQYVLPGCDALGYVGCTGTNVCIRARCLAQVMSFNE
jgi:hypothetical protein